MLTLVNRTPRYLPLAVGKRWRCSRAVAGLEAAGWLRAGCGLAAGWLAEGVACRELRARIRTSTRDCGRDGQARASRGRGSSLWVLGRGGMISDSKVEAHVVPGHHTYCLGWEPGRQAQSCPSKPPSPSFWVPTWECTEHVAAPSIVTRLLTWHRAVTYLTVSVDNPHQIAGARYFHDSHLSAHSIRGAGLHHQPAVACA